MTDTQYGSVKLKNANLLFFGMAVLHVIVDGLIFGFNRKEMFGIFFWVYILLAFIIAIFFLNANSVGETMKHLAFFIGLSLVVIYLPVWKEDILSAFPSLPHSTYVLINAVFLLLGLWPFYIWKTNSLSGGMMTFANFYLIGWLVLVIFVMFMNSYEVFASTAENAPPPMDVGEVLTFIKTNVAKVFVAAGKAPAAIKTSVTQTYNKSTGQEYYKSEVEQNTQDTKIGVYLENMKAADPINYEDQKITFWVTVKAKAYNGASNENDIIPIDTLCTSDRTETSAREGTTNPTHFNVYSYDEQDVDCTFDVKDDPLNPKKAAYSLMPGDHTVSFAAKFNFTTKAYLKSYFADYTLLRSLNKENIDVFKQYNLEANPKAVYTNGPVDIGIETQSVIPVNTDSAPEENPRKNSVAFSLKNRQTGQLKKIYDLKLYVPKGITIIEESGCSKPAKKLAEDDGYSNIYSFPEIEYKTAVSADTPQSIMCYFDIDSDKTALLGNDPITTKYFKVEAKYVYELRRSTAVAVKPKMK